MNLTFILNAVLLIGCAIVGWGIGYDIGADSNVKLAAAGAAFFLSGYLLLFNKMPRGHGDGKYRKLGGIPLYLLFFYVLFGTLGALLVAVSCDPNLIESMRATRSIGFSALVATAVPLAEWYLHSMRETAHIPPRDELLPETAAHIDDRLERIRRDAGSKR